VILTRQQKTARLENPARRLLAFYSESAQEAQQARAGAWPAAAAAAKNTTEKYLTCFISSMVSK
jgi:hypothetical protein